MTRSSVHLRNALAVIVFPVVGAACSGERATIAGDAPEWLATPPAPVRLDVTLDSARGRSKRITPNGGTVTATGANGARYSLRIPRGALLSDEVITLTPVAHVDGLPFAASEFETVQLEPSGLRLLEPGTLTVRSGRNVPVAEQVAFAYHDSGSDAHLAPILPDARGRIEIPVAHFSGYGYGQAAPGDPGRVALQKAASHEARLTARLAGILAAERARLLALDDEDASMDPDVMNALIDAHIEYYDAVLEPLMRIAETDERMAECALQRYLTWERWMHLLGIGLKDASTLAPAGADERTRALQRRRNEADAAFGRIIDNALAKGVAGAIERCRNEQDFTAVRTILTLHRQMALLGRVSDNSSIQEALERASDCLHFEVEFHSVIEVKTPTGGTYHDVVATVPFAKVHDTPQRAPLEYVAYRASGSPARDLFGSALDGQTMAAGILGDAEAIRSAAGTRPGVAEIFDVLWNLNPRGTGTNCNGADEKNVVEVSDTLTVIVAPGIPIELMRLTPVNAGAQMQVTQSIQDGLERATGGEATGAELESARVAGPTVSEEKQWATLWARRHRTDAVPMEGVEVREEAGGAYKLMLAQTSKGVWRADFDVDEPATLGFSTSEHSYIVIRHTPE